MLSITFNAFKIMDQHSIVFVNFTVCDRQCDQFYSIPSSLHFSITAILPSLSYCTDAFTFLVLLFALLALFERKKETGSTLFMTYILIMSLSPLSSSLDSSRCLLSQQFSYHRVEGPIFEKRSFIWCSAQHFLKIWQSVPIPRFLLHKRLLQTKPCFF